MSRTITEPGFYYDMPSEVYHRDPCVTPSLSSGVARTLISHTPAHAYLEHARLGGQRTEATPAMALGGYVHGLCAGDTSDFEVGDYDNFTTKDAKAWRDFITGQGRTPILRKVADRAELIVASLRDKAAAGASRDPFKEGRPEVSAFWKEKEVWMRARYDRLVLTDPIADIWDYKTTTDVSEEAVIRTIIDQGYHIQAEHYIRGVRALAPAFEGRISFILAFVEIEPPFAQRTVVMTEGFLDIASRLLNRAVGVWTACLAENRWPDGSGSTLHVMPPEWLMRKMGLAS